jgi:hypothetical protein
MKTWLVGLSIDIDGVEMMVHHLLTATDLEQAESGIMEMGRTWWPSLKREDDRHTGNIRRVWSGLTASSCSMTRKTASCAALNFSTCG